jgi:hypothetical protein
MTPRKHISPTGKKVCAAVAGLMLIVLSVSSATALQPPRKGCVAVSKGEFNSAKKQRRLQSRFGTYVRTGRILRRNYWFCR